MAAEDKTIKFGLTVDDLGLSKTLTAIRSITTEFNKLVQTFNQLSKGGGGIGGIIGGATNRNMGPGFANSQSARTVGGRGGVGGILTEGLIADKNMFQTIAEGSKNAFKTMQDSLSASVRVQKSEIKGLKSEIDNLGNSYRSIIGNKVNMRAPGIPGYNDKTRLDAATIVNGSGINGGGSSGGAVVVGGGGVAGTARNSGSSGGGLGSAFAFGGMAGLGAGAAMMAVDIIKKTIHQVGASAAANVGFAIQSPTLVSQQAAQFGQMGSLGEEIRGGNVAKNFFMMRALTGSAMHGLNSTNVMQARNEQARINSGMNQMSLSDRSNSLIQGAAGLGLRGLGATIGTTVPGGSNFTPNQLELIKQQFSRDPQRLQELMSETQSQMAQSPRLANMINESYQGAQGRLDIEAQLGAGGNTRKVIMERTGHGGQMSITGDNNGLIYETQFARASREAARLGISLGQLGGFRQQMAQSAGRGLMGYGGNISGATIGGFSGAAQTFGLGAQFGGGVGGGQALMNAAQRGMGGSGVDVTAGNQIAGLVGAGMQSGNFRGNAVEAMQGLMAAGLTGAPGSDMLQARVLQAGMTGFGSITAGSLDPLQQGVNMVAANRAAPGMQQYTKNQLMMLEPIQLINIARGGKIDPTLSSTGITRPMVQKYLKEQTSFALSRFNPSQGGNTRMAKEVSNFMKAGNINTYLQNIPKGQRRENLDILGNAMRLSTGGSMTLDQATGYLTGAASGDKGLFPTNMKGGGAFNPASDALSRSNRLAQGEATASQEQFRSQNAGKAAMAGMTANQNAEMLDTLSGDLVGGAKNFSTALTMLTDAVINNLKKLDPAGYNRQMSRNKEQVKRLNANAKDEGG